MRGDKLVLTPYHWAGAELIADAIRPRLGSDPLAVSIAGESGSGKSEMAFCLAELLEREGRTSVILGQDDYFVLPPKSNHARRLENIDWVGPAEVRLDLLDEHVEALKSHPERPLQKPLVDYDADVILSETLEPGDRDVIIAEGTYTSLLDGADVRAFIDRDYRQTKKARLERGREPALEFLERVLEIEHQEISRHKERADVVIPPPEAEPS